MNVHYPAGVIAPAAKKEKQKPLTCKPGNRGMGFEEDINESNAFYLSHDRALVYKRPTPINVVKVDYSHGAKITSAYFETQSTTDYNGVYRGHYLDFEAKSTKSKTSIPLHNIAPQQVAHLRSVLRQGGIAFFLINCCSLDETYLLDAVVVCDFYEKEPRKSIPFSYIKEHGHLVPEGYAPRYDYLEIVDEFYLPVLAK